MESFILTLFTDGHSYQEGSHDHHDLSNQQLQAGKEVVKVSELTAVPAGEQGPGGQKPPGAQAWHPGT